MIFHLTYSDGQPLYLQLMQQVRLAVETGALKDGDQMPGIRTLAAELAVSHNTVARAYTELQREGVLELRHGSGAYVSAKSTTERRAERLRQARARVRELVASLQMEGLSNDEIQRLFEAEILYTGLNESTR